MSGGVTATVAGEVLRADYIVGCYCASFGGPAKHVAATCLPGRRPTPTSSMWPTSRVAAGALNGELHVDLDGRRFPGDLPTEGKCLSRLICTVSDAAPPTPDKLSFAHDVSRSAIDVMKLSGPRRCETGFRLRVHHRVADAFRRAAPFLPCDAGRIIHQPFFVPGDEYRAGERHQPRL